MLYRYALYIIPPPPPHLPALAFWSAASLFRVLISRSRLRISREPSLFITQYNTTGCIAQGGLQTNQPKWFWRRRSGKPRAGTLSPPCAFLETKNITSIYARSRGKKVFCERHFGRCCAAFYIFFMPTRLVVIVMAAIEATSGGRKE